MPEIIIIGLDGGGTVLPITATKREIVGAMLAKCGHEDALGYFADTYCKQCADNGHKQTTRGK
jgi:hypothetical protein